jgi:predicted amidohydrolase
MSDLTVGLLQSTQFWEDKQANFTHYENTFLTHLSENQVDLLLFPEMFNTGFSMNVSALAETMQGESIQWLTNWAKKLNCQIGASLIIEENNSFYNRFVIVSPKGPETWYNKRHLFRMASENQHFTPGIERVIYELKGWKLMLQICYDLRFPVFSRNQTIDNQKEYDALIYVANWPEKRSYVWKNLLQARAIENQTYCLGVNRVGSDANGNNYLGDTMVIDPWGNIVEHQNNPTENLIITTLQRKVMDDILINFPAFLDAD